MTRQRRAEVRQQTLKHLGDLLQAHPAVDNGLWNGLDDEEAEFARQLTLREGQKLIDRSRS